MTQPERPRVTPLNEGGLFETKRMEAGAGVSWPRHKASVESVLVVTEGRCVVEFADTEHRVSAGESLIIPSDVWHDVLPDPAFKAIHVMPKDIRITFSA